MIAIGTDHAGLEIKNALVSALRAEGREVLDCGTFDKVSCDYPDYAEKVCEAVACGEAERGILVCMTGIGMSVAANKVKGIRAGLVFNTESARLTREHNDTNVLVIPGKFLSVEEALEICKIWLDTGFSGEERHARRVKKIREIEERYFK